MTTEKTSIDPLVERIENLTPDDFEKMRSVFKNTVTADDAALLQTCVHCGLCAESCHYYLTTGEKESIPAYKLNLVSRVFKKYFTFQGKALPSLESLKDLDAKMTAEWIDSLFGRCSLCGRCSINCTMGINILYLIRAARSALASVGLVPTGLQSTVDTAVEKGNNMGISREDWLETVEWLVDELRIEVGDSSADMPVDVKGKKYLYTINPREAMFFPLSITAAAKLFYASGKSWTFSSTNFDVTNYGLYNGDDAVAGELSERLVRAKEDLGCEAIILAECGHGFNSNRWEAPEWLSRRYGFPVRSILEVVADDIRDGHIRLDPSRNTKRTTLHDPCNLVRLGGVVEEQRYILRHAVSDFVEMTPNRENNFCCGGGGGQLAMTRFSERRIKAGKIKADQIAATGAEVVATPCHNCIDQLMELNKHYKLGVEIKTVSEIAADSLVLPDRKQNS